MTLSNNKIDSGDIWLKEDLCLEGDSIKEIFDNITNSSIKLLNNFFNLYKTLKPEKQDIYLGSYHKRRKPEQSKIQVDDFKNKPLTEIYNFIRCLTDPYPNAFIEDENGNKLYFTGVKYKPNNLKNEK